MKNLEEQIKELQGKSQTELIEIVLSHEITIHFLNKEIEMLKGHNKIEGVLDTVDSDLKRMSQDMKEFKIK